MKQLLFALLAIAALNTAAQKNYRIIDGFTLEEMTDYSVTCTSPNATFTKSGGLVSTEKLKKADVITVRCTDFIPATVKITHLKKDEETIILMPDDELLADYKKQHAFYDEIRDTSRFYLYKTGDVFAEFPGGQEALRKYLGKELHYPDEAVACGMEGKVYLQFAVEADGSIGQIRVVRGLALPLDQECVRVIRTMPNWIPANINGQPARSFFNLPLSFTLD